MKIEQLRTQYRNTHKKLQLYTKDDYGKSHSKQYDAKFKCYDSAMDIFTIKSIFEKIYEKPTQRTMLPDLLNNNN